MHRASARADSCPSRVPGIIRHSCGNRIRGKHHPDDLGHEFLLAPQASFELGDQVFGEAQVLQSVLEGLSGLLRLASVTLQALLRLQAAPVSGFGMFFGASFGWGHIVLRCAVWGLW